MHKLTVVSVLLVSALLLNGCRTKDVTPTGPTRAAGVKTQSSTVTPAAALAVTPATVIAQPVRNPFCPSIAPFTAPFLLVVQNGDVAVSITDITLRFTDNVGAGMPPVTLPAPMITARFGSTLLPPQATRTFPMSFGLGCGTGPTGTLVVTVGVRDADGRAGTSQIDVDVH
jgi:hypothetical protein